MCLECGLGTPRASADARRSEAALSALRLVLMMVLDGRTAALALAEEPEAALTLWPSSLYTRVAHDAVRSPAAWQRCASLLDRALGGAATRFECAAPADIVRSAAELTARTARSPGPELAALLWSLLRRTGPLLDTVVGRLRAEIEVLAVRGFGRVAADGAAKPLLLPSATGATHPLDARLRERAR